MNVGNINLSLLSPIIKWIVTFFQFFLIAAAMGVVTYFTLYLKRYNINVVIFSKRKHVDKIIFDKGGYFKSKEGVWSFKLRKMKVSIQPPDYSYLIPTARGNLLFLRQISVNEFYPIMPEINEQGLKLNAIEGDVALWSALMGQRIREMYQKQNWFEKYGSFIIFGIFAMLIIVLIYIVLQKFEVLQSVASSLEHTASLLKESGRALPSSAP